MISFDVRKALIPFSLLQISNAFKGMKPGESIEVIADDSGVAADLQRLLPPSGDIIMASRILDRDEPPVRLVFYKKKFSQP